MTRTLTRPARPTPVDTVIQAALVRDPKMIVLKAVTHELPALGTGSAGASVDDAFGRDSLGKGSAGKGSAGKDFAGNEALGKRIMTMPYSPRTVIGAAVGAAGSGVQVVADLREAGTPVGLAEELLRFESALKDAQTPLPMILRARWSAFKGSDDHTARAAASLCAQMALMPVALPSCSADAAGMAATAIALRQPVLLFEHDALNDDPSSFGPGGTGGTGGEMPRFIRFGSARILRNGWDLTVVALSRFAPAALSAAIRLEREEGITCEVIDPRTIAPLDVDTIITSLERTGRLLILDDGPPMFGLSAEIAASVAERAPMGLHAPVQRPDLRGLVLREADLMDLFRHAFHSQGAL